MKIIITKRFEKYYNKSLSKYFDMESFVMILKDKKHNFISLHDPFYKFKNKINFVDFRWVLAIFKDETIIPIFIYLKKDKKNWENINWNDYKKKIEFEFNFATLDIENGDYIKY